MVLKVTEDKELIFKGTRHPCQIGRGGFVSPDEKREGDGATPRGTYSLRQLFYRPDKVVASFPSFLRPMALTKEMKWCDAPNSPLYNQLVLGPLAESHEELWRSDDVYDIIIVIGYNDNPTVAHRGSAIFFHVSNENKTPTAGCVAMEKNTLISLCADSRFPDKITLGS